MTRAAIYVRISADREGHALGVERQEVDCRLLAARLGWTVAEVYSDNDVSAYSGKPRKNYDRMLSDIAAGAVTGVLAYAPDRLYRRLADLKKFSETVEAAGCQVQTCMGGEVNFNTAEGWQNAHLMGVLAEGEVRKLKQRVKRKLDERKAAGLPHGGQRPYGWEPDRLTIREDEAQWIRWGVTQTLGGIPLRSQFRELNAKGVTNSRGGLWSHATYRGVLVKARHAGLMTDGSPGTWPAIITPERHRALLRLLDAPERVTTPGRAGKVSLLGSLALCGLCGSKMRAGKGSGSSGPSYLTYRCYPSGHVQRNRGHIDDFVYRVIAARLRRGDAVRLLAGAEDDAAHEARAAAEVEAERLRLLIDETADEHARAGLSVRALAAYLAPLQQQLAAAEETAVPPRDRSAVLGDIAGADDRGAAFLAAPVERQRAVIDMLAAITIGRGPRGNVFDPAGIEIVWREG